MAWELRNSVSMPGEKTGAAVVRFDSDWYWTRSEFEALAKEDAHGIYSADQLISLMQHIIQSDDQYTKYGSEVRTYLVLTVRNLYSTYVECMGLVSPEEMLGYYRQASTLYDGYNDIQGYIYQSAVAKANAAGAENSVMKLDSSTYTLVTDESKVKAKKIFDGSTNVNDKQIQSGCTYLVFEVTKGKSGGYASLFDFFAENTQASADTHLTYNDQVRGQVTLVSSLHVLPLFLMSSVAPNAIRAIGTVASAPKYRIDAEARGSARTGDNVRACRAVRGFRRRPAAEPEQLPVPVD